MWVDGVLLQLRPVSSKAFAQASASMLDAHREFEQKYQRENFADTTFTSHGMCKGSVQGYREWMTTFADNKGWKHQVYVTFEVGPTTVMMANAPYGTDAEKAKVATLVAALCRSFKTDW
jgi:hypothetical protein